MSHQQHNRLHLASRAAKAGAVSEPVQSAYLMDASILQPAAIYKRTPGDSTETASSTCAPNEKCEKGTSSSANLTLPIVLGAAIPLTFALILLLFLHRRHVKKLRKEDANDRHKSLDFGMDPSDAPMTGPRKNKKSAVSVMDLETEKAFRRGRGMSMDIGNPYLLPPELQSSRESLHSLSRSIHNGDDPYRQASTFNLNDSSMPMYPSSNNAADDSSSYTGSSGPGSRQDGMNQNLLHNAQRMSRSLPPTQRTSVMSSRSSLQIRAPEATLGLPPRGLPSNPRDAGRAPKPSTNTRDSYIAKDGADLRRSNNYLGAFIHSGDPSTDKSNRAPSPPEGQRSLASPPTLQGPPSQWPPPQVTSVPTGSPPPPRKQSLQSPTQPIYNENSSNKQSNYGIVLQVVPPSSAQVAGPGSAAEQRHSRNLSMSAVEEYHPNALDTPDFGFDTRRLSMGLRPLPREDPTDNPEQRANRIRSFYKEYFDDSKPTPTYAPEDYYEDYGQAYIGGESVFDPASGQFVVAQAPYAEPITRRAMTPPPRAPPRFQGPGRHQPTMSNPRYMVPGPRAFSSASGRFGPPARGPPRKMLPPPGPLRTLPTPHMLKEDAFALPIDFAPPANYKDRQAGKPESPRVQLRPYSPMLPAHVPLVSSFDDLSVMPSPHHLRKSGTFTALDFAPPPRFKNSDSGSDAGSIRSGRTTASAMSAAQTHNIRAGAYRISRIPKEVVGTKNEISDSLKPTWNLR